MIFKFDESQTIQQLTQYNRKDSGSSEVAAFLNPSGRTSRISSVGSQGSAVSRLSGVSGISRSPSPHKMLVETSFCGPKPIEPTSDAGSIEHLTADIESVILARRGDPTRVALAEGVEVKEAVKPPTKTTKEKLQEISNSSMSPVEAARAAAKEERRREIEALKVRLNAINQKQLEKKNSVGQVKKVIGVTPEGTEYIRIKLKPDHLYADNGVSPNEKVVEEKEFSEHAERKKDRVKKEDQTNRKSPLLTHAPDNRSPSPASASVSRKSSFCSFFKSKETPCEATKSKPTAVTTGKSKLSDKSPLNSPSKSSSFSSRIAFTLFKSNRNPSPSQLIEPSSSYQEGVSKKSSLPSQSKQSSNGNDKPRLRYYDAPDVIHIPLHTPPEEKEFSALKKSTQENNKKEDIDAITKLDAQEEKKVQSQPQVSLQHKIVVNTKPKIAPTAQIEKMQSTDEVELHEMPVIRHKGSEDKDAGSSLWSVEVQRHSSQESQETVISSQPKNENIIQSKNGIAEKPAIPSFIDTTNENQPLNQPKGRHKKHILFSTKLGSGSEEQIFSTQLSLSKTESQSSQLSEQASVFESPKNEESGTKVQEVTRNNLKHQSSSEVEKVTATSARSRSDQSDAGSRPQSVTRKQQQQHQRSSGEFSKKRESSAEEMLHKISRETSKEKVSQQVLNYQQSPTSYESIQATIKSSENASNSILQQQSSGSRMEISSESDRESDIDGCIHKRVSRLMEDHESAGLVLQESFDDELPYVPTTLPEERSSGIKIIPTRERTQTELITIPVERPRSTTPINPTSLDNFCEKKATESNDANLVRGEKLRISLPRKQAEQNKEKVQQKSMTRRTSNLSNKSWTEFAEQGLQNTSALSNSKKCDRSRKESGSSQDGEQHSIQHHHPQPPTGPIVKSHSKKSLTSKWIDFENIPEKRQQPKKITTIPLSKDMPSEKIHNSKHSHHQRHYVSPEECQCECHESKKESDNKQSTTDETGKTPSDDSPLVDDNVERHSTMR